MSLLTLHYKQLQFSPGLIPSLMTLLLLLLLISLGFWQLDRAEQKRQIDAGVHNAIKQTPLNLNRYLAKNLATSTSSAALNQQVYRHVTATGEYDNKTFLLDNRTYQGKAGFHVITPYLFADQNQKQHAVLVNRGWVPFQGNRTNIPDILLKKPQAPIVGNIKPIGKSILLNDSEESSQLSSQFPRIIQSVSLDKLSKTLNYPLLPVLIELDKSQENGFIRDWKPYYGSVDKHIAYAVQWFSMAAVLVILYIKTNTKKISTSNTVTQVPH